MDVIFTHGAGVDGKDHHGLSGAPGPHRAVGRWAHGAQRMWDHAPGLARLVRLAGRHGGTHVALESTGAYWHLLYHILAGDFTVCLIHAEPVQPAPRRQTGQAAARWLAKRMR